MAAAADPGGAAGGPGQKVPPSGATAPPSGGAGPDGRPHHISGCYQGVPHNTASRFVRASVKLGRHGPFVCRHGRGVSARCTLRTLIYFGRASRRLVRSQAQFGRVHSAHSEHLSNSIKVEGGTPGNNPITRRRAPSSGWAAGVSAGHSAHPRSLTHRRGKEEKQAGVCGLLNVWSGFVLESLNYFTAAAGAIATARRSSSKAG